jgi:hypothetical protein
MINDDAMLQCIDCGKPAFLHPGDRVPFCTSCKDKRVKKAIAARNPAIKIDPAMVIGAASAIIVIILLVSKVVLKW